MLLCLQEDVSSTGEQVYSPFKRCAWDQLMDGCNEQRKKPNDKQTIPEARRAAKIICSSQTPFGKRKSPMNSVQWASTKKTHDFNVLLDRIPGYSRIEYEDFGRGIPPQRSWRCSWVSSFIPRFLVMSTSTEKKPWLHLQVVFSLGKGTQVSGSPVNTCRWQSRCISCVSNFTPLLTERLTVSSWPSFTPVHIESAPVDNVNRVL